LFRRRNGIFFIEDRTTGRQQSLQTKEKEEAKRVLHAKNEAEYQPHLNLQIARAYLMASDPVVATRTWQHVMEEIVKLKHDVTAERWRSVLTE
jgi:hypothetical protein